MSKTVEETIVQIAMFQQRLDAVEHGIVQDGVAHPTWEELGPLDGQETYLQEAQRLVQAMQKLGWSPSAPVEGDEREALSADLTAHVEGVAYADDIAEGGDPVPDDYERHYCEEDGEDWPCTAVRQASERVPGEPFTLEEIAREHERLAEHPNQMSQTVPGFHALTAKALRWAASRRPSTPTEEDVERAARAMAIFGDYDGCFERIDEWNACDEWDRQAHPENEPRSDYEDAEWWRARARAALSAVHPEVTQ